jgi:peptide/nickel transport system substrate-binding protein
MFELRTAWRLWIVLALVFSGCVPGVSQIQTQDVTAEEPTAGPLRVALSQTPSSLDPADYRGRVSETVIRNMFDGLVTRDTRSGIHLELAENMVWVDSLTLLINLRRGVLFHDGVEMTAEDVVFTFNRIIAENGIEYPEPHTSPRRGLIAPLESVQMIDAYTVRMHFTTAWPPAMQMLTHQQIVPKHYFLQVGSQGFNQYPIGTGPFKFVSASDDLMEITIERFSEYYGGAPALPPVGEACVEQVIFSVIPDNQTRVAALKAGEVDIIQSVPIEYFEILDAQDDIQVKSAPGTRPLWMELNVNMEPFNDVRVRQALNFAIDKQRIIEEVFQDRAVALPGPLSPYNEFVNHLLEPYPYDIDQARSLLEEAGIIEPELEGVSDKIRSIESISLPPPNITIDTLAEWKPLAEQIADQLRVFGFSLQVRVWERETISPQLLAGERIAYLDGWGDSAFDPVGHFEAKWHAYTPGEIYGRANYSGFDNERVNELIRLGETEANAFMRRAYYDEAQTIVYEEAPAIFLVLPEHIEAASSRVSNWEPASDGRINLHDVCLSP